MFLLCIPWAWLSNLQVPRSFPPFCEVCGAVYVATDLKRPISVLTQSTPTLQRSDHFFFSLSNPACVSFLKQWCLDGRLQPEVSEKLKECLAPKNGHPTLQDWDISRDGPYFCIEIPNAPGKYFYVWLDAPVGYLSALESHLKKSNTTLDSYFSNPNVEQYHFIGKDITTFHTLFWPAMLKFSGRKVPDNVFVHGFLTVDGKKMSKSRGTGIDPLKYLSLGFDPEWLRYYFFTKLNNTNADIDFNSNDFALRVNSDLVGKLVNLVSRAQKFAHGTITTFTPLFDYNSNSQYKRQ